MSVSGGRSGDGGRSRRRATAVALVAAALAVVGATRPARAECAPNAALGTVDARLGAIDVERRLSWIDGELARGARHARTWTWGWGIALGVGTVANLVPLTLVSPSSRVDWYTGAATTAVGVLPLVIAPLDVVADSRALRARLAARPAPAVDGRARPDACALLADAEVRLARDAKNQADGRRWWLHLGNVLLNTGVGAFLAIGFHHWGAGVFNAISGAVIGEAIIFTQPTGAIDGLRRYRDGALDDATPTTSLAFTRAF